MALYERSVRLYTNATCGLSGMLGDDLARALAEAEKVRIACQDANIDLMAHWRSEHANSPIHDGA